MKLQERVIVKVPISSPEVLHSASAQRVLESHGFRDVAVSADMVQAFRGSHLATLLRPGDGRRWYHTIRIDSGELSYTIDTWFGIFTRADESVFKSEGRGLIDEISGRQPDTKSLAEAISNRRRSDVKVLLCLIAIGVILGLVLVGALVILENI